MQCPSCQQHIPELWQALVQAGDGGSYIATKRPDGSTFTLLTEWMVCSNDLCRELLIKVTRAPKPLNNARPEWWFAAPRLALTRPLPVDVPTRLRDYYAQVAAVAAISPSLAAVGARRLMADVLREAGGYLQQRLHVQVGAFLADPEHPIRLKSVLEALREAGNLGAHSQFDAEDGSPIEIDSDDASLCLDAIDLLFEYYYVDGHKSLDLAAKIAAKAAAAGRNPLRDAGGGTQ